MKRATEKLQKMTGVTNLKYDGIDHTTTLKDHADSVQEYVDRVKDSDICLKTSAFDRHLSDNPKDVKVVSFSDMDNYLICYALIYGSSLSPFFVSGNRD
mgnify:CR=1 FL=1